MTSPFAPLLLTSNGSLDFGKLSAKVPCSLQFQMKPANDHGLCLAVAICGKGGKPDTDHAAIFGDLRDEVRITVLRPFIENEDWRARGSGLADDRAHRNLAGSMQ
ncbi:hypothetical protein [Sinorhizobium meliloti]|uniref:hypothetical protein n=1 Tax=Rhizobium meliloti TaxID=382 RepID=UPI0012970506|nr:hypothetical protein [Sinorhizobium meliloti]MQX90285.1 hypothetical protein [Sinorhizobium meliloti]